MKTNFYNQKEIADIIGLPPKTFQRWTKEIGFEFGRGLISEESIPEIREEIRKYALQKVKKRPPNLPPNDIIS